MRNPKKAHGPRPGLGSAFDEHGPTFWKAALTNDPDDFREAEKARDNINRPINDEDVTPAHIAAAYGHFNFILDAVQLPQFNARVCDSSGRTPFDYAAARKDKETMIALFNRMNDAGPPPKQAS